VSDAQRPSKPATRPEAAERPSQLPSQPGGTASRPSQLPGKPDAGISDRPGTKPAQRPSKTDVGNFLGIAGGAAAGGAIGGALASRPSQLPTERSSVGERARAAERPEQRQNWSERSQNRNEQWHQRVESRHEAWNQRADQRQQANNDFQQNREERWNNLESAREDRQMWRDQNREDWQQHREDLWEYRGDRAEEIWDNTRDFYDDVFDDRWWGATGWGVGWIGHYPANPWWWWGAATWGAVTTFVDAITPEPVYVDYGVNVIYEDETVYVNNKPTPADQYTQPIEELAVNVDQPPPPMPPIAAPAQTRSAQPQTQPPAQTVEDWLSLGVFALAQEEKGDPVMFFQISVNRAGAISGAYQSTLTGDQRPIAGQIDKATQRAA
jgi:hypothetical protein